MAGLFQVLKGQKDGTFKKPEPLLGDDGEPLIIPIEGDQQQIENICTRPTAIDWDGDGDLDLVVGNFAGTFYAFLGEGKGKFQAKPEMIMAKDEPLRVPGYHSDPFIVNWDADGDLDLLSGSNQGGVYWAENTAGKGKTPQLLPFETLIPVAQQVEYGQTITEKELVGPTQSTRIWIDDVNEDGKLDVLVGDNVTLTSPAEGLGQEEFEEKSKKWQAEIDKTYQEIEKAAEDPEKRETAVKRYSELYKERESFVVEERTGFVWLYLQK